MVMKGDVGNVPTEGCGLIEEIKLILGWNNDSL